MVFAMLGQTESSGECEQTLERPQQTLAPNPSQRYRLRLLRRRVALCVFASPATISNLLAGGTGPCVQLFAMAAFIVVVAALQRHISGTISGYHDIRGPQ